MPGKWVSGAILLFFLASNSIWFYRDLLPELGFGELRYRDLLATRAVEETSAWSIRRQRRRVGELLSSVQPQPDGRVFLRYTGRLDAGTLVPILERRNPIGLYWSTEFRVTPDGRLEQFSVSVRMDELEVRIVANGRVEGNQVIMDTHGLGNLDGRYTFELPGGDLVMDSMGPFDRLPGLQLGQTWTTLAVNPLALAPSAPIRNLLQATEPLIVIKHRVLTTESIPWNKEQHLCFVVEHRQPWGTARSWVRVSDSRVLRQETVWAGIPIIIELEPSLERTNSQIF